MKHIKTINNLIIIEFNKGIFDSWCVYITSPRRGRFAPTDLEYFTRLILIGKEFSYQSVYDDFVEIYERTTSILDDSILSDITSLSSKYASRALEMDVWLTVIYAGMVAEENKNHAVLKKKIKRLGMYQLLIDKESPEFAANFSRGKTVAELKSIMAAKGF